MQCNRCSNQDKLYTIKPQSENAKVLMVYMQTEQTHLTKLGIARIIRARYRMMISLRLARLFDEIIADGKEYLESHKRLATDSRSFVLYLGGNAVHILLDNCSFLVADAKGGATGIHYANLFVRMAVSRH